MIGVHVGKPGPAVFGPSGRLLFENEISLLPLVQDSVESIVQCAELVRVEELTIRAEISEGRSLGKMGCFRLPFYSST